MHDNKFERDVQGKMNALRMEPPAPVWAEVEARIRKERKKRRLLVFWMLLPLGLLLGGAGWWLLRVVPGNSTYAVRGKGQEPGRSKTSPVPAAGTTTKKQPPPAETTSNYDTTASGNSPVQRAEINNEIISNTEQPPSEVKGTAQLFIRKGSKSKSGASTARKTNAAQAKQGSMEPDNIPGGIAATTGTNARESTAPSATPTAAPAARNTAPLLPDSSSRAIALATASKDSQLYRSDPTAAAPKPHKRRPQWALEGSAGVAVPVNTWGGINADTLTGGVSGYSAGTYSKQQWRSGPRYTIGGRLLLPLYGRLHLQAGLDIGLLQLTSETFSAAGPSAPFGAAAAAESKSSSRIRWVLLQVPVALEGRPSARLPLSLWGGASLTTLLGNTGRYGLPRTSFSLQAGARYRVARVGSGSLELGPQVWYGLKRFNANQRLAGATAVLRLSF